MAGAGVAASGVVALLSVNFNFLAAFDSAGGLEGRLLTVPASVDASSSFG